MTVLEQTRNMKDGREFHNDSSSKYWLPSDDEEADRLKNQHMAMKKLFGGNISQPLTDVISPVLEKGGKFLDLCCGTGIFISEVATEFPNCECVGVDLVDIFKKSNEVENVSFQECNILKGLPFEDDTFDAVSLNFGILAFSKDEWKTLTREVKRVLKAGGYMLSREPGRILPTDDFAKWVVSKYNGRITANGQVEDIAEQLKIILMDEGYDETGAVTKAIYSGRSGEVNERYHKNAVLLFKSLLPNLASDLELTHDKYKEFLEKFSKCLDEPNTMFQVTFTYGRKPILYSE